MQKDELIKKCRYYKGEEKSPFTGKSEEELVKNSLWFYEMGWVEEMLRGKDPNYLAIEYTSFPTKNIDPEDKVPFSLKCLLFNRYGKNEMGTREETAKGFAEFLKRYYDV